MAVSGDSLYSGSEESSPGPRGHMLPRPGLRVFSYWELKATTRNFRSDTVVGEGGFGKVYKGWLDSKNGITSESSVVAVKKLNSESMQGFQEWQVLVLIDTCCCNCHQIY